MGPAGLLAGVDDMRSADDGYRYREYGEREFSLPIVETNCYAMAPTSPTPAMIRTALEGSIAKWQRIVEGTGRDHGAQNCPLCQLFYYKFNPCIGCPVMDRTGQSMCLGSPYAEWVFARHAHSDNHVKTAIARKELAFLKGLL